MRITFIVPCYNVDQYIGLCLDSINSQDMAYDSFEIICVDDGSVDNTIDAIQIWKKDHPGVNLTLLQQPNQGQSVARNQALQFASGQYIWFVDADDYIRKDSLVPILEKAERKELDILWFDHNLVGEQGELLPKPKEDVKHNISLDVHTGSYYLQNGFKYSCMPVMFLFSVAFLKRNNFLFEPGIFFEDILFTSICIDQAERMSYIQIDAYRYLIRYEGSTMRDESKRTKRLLDALIVSAKLKKYVAYAQTPEYFKKFSSLIATYKLKEALSEGEGIEYNVSQLVSKYQLRPLYMKGSMKVQLMAAIFNISPSLFKLLLKKKLNENRPIR